MKKLVLCSVLAVIVAGGVFALPEFKLSAGAGGYFIGDFGGGIETSGSQTISTKTPYCGGGGFAFFDATYVELDLSFFGGWGQFKQETGSSTQESAMSPMGLTIGLLGKCPTAVSKKLTIFPLLGIAYRIMLSVNEYQNSAPSDFSALWFRLGGGMDYSFTDKLFLRSEILYGLRLANKFENDMKSTISSHGVDVKTLLGHGFEVKIALGYNF
jgi:opacity protein-like surface antigen